LGFGSADEERRRVQRMKRDLVNRILVVDFVEEDGLL
jgi:hypothetical protein